MKQLLSLAIVCFFSFGAKAQQVNFYIENISNCNMVGISKIYAVCPGTCSPIYELQPFLVTNAPLGTTAVSWGAAHGSWNVLPPCPDLDPIGFEFDNCETSPAAKEVWDTQCMFWKNSSETSDCCLLSLGTLTNVTFARIPQVVPPGAPDMFVLYLH